MLLLLGCCIPLCYPIQVELVSTDAKKITRRSVELATTPDWLRRIGWRRQHGLFDLDGSRVDAEREAIDEGEQLVLISSRCHPTRGSNCMTTEGNHDDDGDDDTGSPVSVERWDPWIVPIGRGRWRMYFLRQRVASAEFWDGAHIATVASQEVPAGHPRPFLSAVSWREERFVQFAGWEVGNRTRLLAGCTAVHPKTGELYLFYNNATVSNRHELALQLAVSAPDDGVNFHPLPGWLPLRPDHGGAQYYVSEGAVVPWRDPFVFFDPASGGSRLLLSSAHRKVGGTAFKVCINGTGYPTCPDTYEVYQTFHGCVAVAATEAVVLHREGRGEMMGRPQGLEGPWRLLPGLTTGVGSVVAGPFSRQSGFWEMERPSMVAFGLPQGGGYRYHLFFNCWLNKVNPHWAIQHLAGKDAAWLSNSNVYHMVSESVDGPFITSPTSPVLIGSQNSGLYGISLNSLDTGVAVAGRPSHVVHGWKLRGDQATRDDWLALGKTRMDNTLAMGTEHTLVWREDGEPELVGPFDPLAQPCTRNRKGLCGGIQRVPADMLELTEKVRDFSHWRGFVESHREGQQRG